MGYNYSKQDFKKEHMARVVGRALGISYKASIEICNNLRGKEVSRAKRILNDIISKSVPIRFSRFTNGAGHKKSIGPGKYPLKAAKEILTLLETAEANAQFKGLNTSNLRIVHISAQNGGNQWRYGRVRRRRMKRTTVELVIEETKRKKEEKKTAKSDVKASETPKKAQEKIEKKEVKSDAAQAEKPKKIDSKAEPAVQVKNDASKEDKLSKALEKEKPATKEDKK